CLGKSANIYLLDEPSAYLDCEQRLIVSKIIKKFVTQHNKIAFIVEHDFLMASYLADKVIVFEGTPGIEATACSPETGTVGINHFLSILQVTFRRDPVTGRPRINKFNSVLDKEQKMEGKYYCEN